MTTIADALRHRLFPLGDDRDPARRAPHEHFLVASWGHTGSIWLAGSLNLHEQLCVTCGIDNPLESFAHYPLHRDPVALAAEAGPALAAHGFTAWEGAALAPVRAHPAMRAVVPRERDLSRLPHYILDELDHIAPTGPYTVVGNVHGVTLSQLDAAVAGAAGMLKRRRVLVADLIRHPVGRTESAINATITRHLAALAPRIDAFLAEHARDCATLERRYGIDFTEPRARAALHVFRQGLQNDVWASEIRTFPGVYRILLERLQNEPEYFSHVFFLLAQGRATADRGFLDRVFAPENLGSGRQSPQHAGARPAGPREQYERWSAFERDEFARVAARLELPAVYFEFGYDLSFLTRNGLGRGSWFADMVDAGSSRA